MNENGKTINHTNLMNFVLQTKGVFYFLNRNSTGDLAQLTYFFGLSKVKGWTTHTTTYEIQKKKKIVQSIVTNPKFLYKQNC